MKDTWGSRDLPVLVKIVETCDASMGAQLPGSLEIARELGMDINEVGRALAALDGTYIDLARDFGPPDGWLVVGVTPKARQAAGQWPSAERVTMELVNQLEVRADAEPDIERRSRLRATAATLKDVAWGVSTDVMAKVISNSMGI